MTCHMTWHMTQRQISETEYTSQGAKYLVIENLLPSCLCVRLKLPASDWSRSECDFSGAYCSSHQRTSTQPREEFYSWMCVCVSMIIIRVCVCDNVYVYYLPVRCCGRSPGLPRPALIRVMVTARESRQLNAIAMRRICPPCPQHTHIHHIMFFSKTICR